MSTTRDGAPSMGNVGSAARPSEMNRPGGGVNAERGENMTEARTAREALVVAHHQAEDETKLRMSREALVVAHHFPEANTNLRAARLSLVIAISRPHGWDVFDDPPL